MVRGIHVPEELGTGVLADVSGADPDRLNSQLLAGLGDIDGVLEENNWVIVGEGHRPASALHRRIGNGQHQLGRPPRLTGTAAVGKPFGLNS